MTVGDIELYHLIGKWVNRYHASRYRNTQLLVDFQHDLFLKLRGRVNSDSNPESYIKKFVWHYVSDSVMPVHYQKSRFEIAVLDDEGCYVDFADAPATVEQEAPHKVGSKVKVVYRGGDVKWFASVKDVAEYEGVGASAIYYLNTVGTQCKYQNKKLSHIKEVKIMKVNNPFSGSKVQLSKRITRKTYETNDTYKDYKYDPELDCDYNEFYQIVTDGKDYILIREKGD